MKSLSQFTAGAIGTLLLTAPFVCAAATSVSIQSLSPGATVFAKDRLTFIIVATGFGAQSYQLTDSFPASTASVNNISGNGNFYWVPLVSDVGSHTFTIIAQNGSGDTASTTQTIQVAPLPSLSVTSVSPGTTIMPGTQFSFLVTASGLTKPSYTVSDSFSGSSAHDTNIDTSGNFSWTPDVAQNGDHTITIYASDSTGHNASIGQAVHVGAGPTLTITPVSIAATTSPGLTVSFTAVPMNFSPTSFSVSDNFPKTTISNSNISATGLFTWMPQASDVGVHFLTIKGIVGAYGQSTTTTQTITVLGPGGSATAPAPVSSTTSNTASSTLLSALQAQLSALLAKASTQSSASSSTTSPLSFIFNAYLRPGMHGDEVAHLQTVLSQLGFFSDTPSGYYGKMTIDAVSKFQAAHGLDKLGVVGPATRALLNSLSTGQKTIVATTTPSTASDGYVFNNFMGLGEDSTDGTDVLELQKRLTSLGIFTGEQTGNFGSATEKSVKKFQSARGIRVTGYVGAETRAALNK